MANFMRAEFESIARRQARRFRLLAIAQILGLPLFAILTVAVMAGPIFVIGWKVFPYGLADITANFRRASAAWQSYATAA
jgi:cytochrome b561